MSPAATYRFSDTASPAIFSAHGYCRSCNGSHGLPMGDARSHCQQLIYHFCRHQTIDLTESGDSDPRLSTGYLFGPARGKMFGVLECRDHHGATVVLRAFSGQYNGLWLVEGWAPPLFDTDRFAAVNDPAEAEIKELGRQLDQLAPHSEKWLAVKRHRRSLSRQLMQDLHGLYHLTNFHGRSSSLADAVTGVNGIPTGTGDCCAPKLLNQAARQGLTPVSIAEFYWGLDNLSGRCRHGQFYPSCQEKCQPILGFLLCGAMRSHSHDR